MKAFKYSCVYCDKKYKLESAFLKHSCDQQERSVEAKTLRGQLAYEYYKLWNELRHYSVPPLTTFIESTQYLAFIRFVDFTKKSNIPGPREYIKVMVSKQLTPTMWINTLAYKHYIGYMDKRMSSKSQVDISIETLFDICEKHHIEDTADIFEHIIPNELIHYVIRRQLSPWFLLNSKKFLKFFANECSDHNRNTFTGIHSPELWKQKFDDNKEEVARIKEIVDELGL